MGAEAMGCVPCPTSSSRPPLMASRQNESTAGKRQTHQMDDKAALKRPKTDGMSRSNSQAADELLGRQGAVGAAPAGPSSFTCFSLGQPPSDNVAKHGMTGPAQPMEAHTHSLATFTDIAMNAGTCQDMDKASLAARKSSLLALRLTSASQSTASEQPAAQHGSRAVQPQPVQQAELVAQHCLPYDWALKSSARFTCSKRFVAYDASAVASSRHALHAGASRSRHHWEGLPVQEQWHTSLTSLRHPPSCWDPAAIAALQRAAPALLDQRLQAWQQAFTSAYMAVRHSQACAMYLETATGCRHPYTVLFCAPGARGCAQPHALISTSSRQSRSKMQAAGLEFTMPLAQQSPSLVPGAPAPRPTLCTDPMDLDDDIIEQPAAADGAAAAPAPRDHSPQSVLLFLGPQAVHMLFDWLLQDVGFVTQQGGEVLDVPVLLAPVAFQGGSAWRPDIKSTTSTVSSSTGGQQQQQQQHVLELTGPLPPWVLCRLCALLGHTAAVQEQSFQINFTTSTHNLSLNVWAGVAQTQDRPQGKAGAETAPETAAWEVVPYERGAVCTALPALGRRVVRTAAMEPLAPTDDSESTGIQYRLRLSG